MLKAVIKKLKTFGNNIQILVYAYRNKSCPLIAKIAIGITLVYFFSPIDLIPDFIPVIGMLDDVIIVPLLVWLAIKLVPVSILTIAKQQAKDHPIIPTKKSIFLSILISIFWGLVCAWVIRKLWVR